jgi:hypothetical protein
MLRLEYMPLSVLKKWPRNPKQHDLEGINKSIDRFGFNDPIEIDEKSGLMVAGHGRIESLLEKQKNGEDPPERIRVKGKEWLVPVIRGIEFKNKKEAEAYLLANNQLTIKLGWDETLLAPMLQELSQEQLDVTGFTPAEIRDFLALLPENQKEEQELPPIPETPITKLGDIWQLGKHRRRAR